MLALAALFFVGLPLTHRMQFIYMGWPLVRRALDVAQ